jgi:dienelactone hydrolase
MDVRTSMNITSDTTESGIRARRFTVDDSGQPVPGIVWSPGGADGIRPKVLFGHGGGQDKEAPNLVAMAKRLVLEHGYACVAVDHAGHGERVSEEERVRQREAARARERARQEATATGVPVQRPQRATGAYNNVFQSSVSGWKVAIDAVEQLPDVGAGPTGWWGVSMGTGVGLPFVASEPRFTCAVFGLASTSADNDAAIARANSISIPVLFLAQADDGGHPVDRALVLWGALGSKEKTMHLNPGPHIGIPKFERDASIQFFVRHLGLTT